MPDASRPTKSVLYIPSQLNIFLTNILLIVKYKYFKSFSGYFYSPKSLPAHNIMRYINNSVFLVLFEMICTTAVPFKKGRFWGANP